MNRNSKLKLEILGFYVLFLNTILWEDLNFLLVLLT